jgi:hypothetical protein
VTQYTNTLEVYSLEEILELNDVTEEEALEFLVTQDFLRLPNIKAIDFDE